MKVGPRTFHLFRASQRDMFNSWEPPAINFRQSSVFNEIQRPIPTFPIPQTTIKQGPGHLDWRFLLAKDYTAGELSTEEFL